MYSKSPVQRQQGTQETVIDKEVALASQAQGMAPAAAAPPLQVRAVAPLKPTILVGGPVPNGPHERAPAPQLSGPSYPEADAFARAEIARRIKLGGFVDTGMDTMSIRAIPEGPMAYLGDESWKLLMPVVPQSASGLHFRPGEQFNGGNMPSSAVPTSPMNSTQILQNAMSGNFLPAGVPANSVPKNSLVVDSHGLRVDKAPLGNATAEGNMKRMIGGNAINGNRMQMNMPGNGGGNVMPTVPGNVMNANQARAQANSSLSLANAMVNSGLTNPLPTVNSANVPSVTNMNATMAQANAAYNAKMAQANATIGNMAGPASMANQNAGSNGTIRMNA